MQVYIILFICLLILVLLDGKCKQSTLRIPLLFVAIFIIALPALRCSTSSADTLSYIYHFQYPDRGYNGEKTEPLYELFVRLLGVVSKDWRFFITAETIVAILPVFFLIYKYSKNLSFSLYLFTTFGPVIFFYLMYFGNIRQTVSLGFICLSQYYLMQKNYGKMNKIKSILFWVMASFIHTSSFIGILCFFIDRVKLKRKQIIYIIVGAVVLGGSNVLSFFSFLNAGDTFYFNTADLGATGSSFTLAFPLLCSSIMVLSRPVEEFNNSFWMKMFFFMGVLLMLFSNSIANNIDRFVLVFFPSAIIAIPAYFKNAKTSIYTRLFCYAIIIFYANRFFVNLTMQMLNVAGSPVPYTTYFD